MIGKKLREILKKTRYAINPAGYPIGGEGFNNAEMMILNQAQSQIKALIVSELEKKITPLLLKNRPANELHWGIYLGDSKEEAIAELRENLTKGE